MNMKSLFTFLAAFILSFNVFAHEIQEIPAVIAPDQASSFVKLALNQDNSPDLLFADTIVNSHTIPQASADKSSDFITALSVYLLIIIVYSIYGFKANSRNIKN